jgi:MoxR-like ATPase
VLWQAFEAETPVALLIDEIDKADIEFPNDLLRELDRMEFYVYETRETIKARHRPLVFITSNNEKELPDAFLRRCFFHYIRSPTATRCSASSTSTSRPQEGTARRGAQALLRGPRPAGPEEEAVHVELLDWLKLLLAEDIPPKRAARAGRQGKRSRRCTARC